MSFEDLETEDENVQGQPKHVVVAKHNDTHNDNIEETNFTETSVNHTRSEQTNYSNEEHRRYNLRNKSPQY
jgi:hypothetical protein